MMSIKNKNNKLIFNFQVVTTIFIICCASLFKINLAAHNKSCVPRLYRNAQSVVCVCNASLCDTFNFDWNTKEPIVQIQSTLAGERFEVSKPKPRTANIEASKVDKLALSNALEIQVDLSKKLQTVVGFGGAFTDAFLINLIKLPEKVANSLMGSYFSNSGIEYSLGRVPTGGSDFSNHSYSYDDIAKDDVNDLDLKHWLLAREDINFKIPYIKKAVAMTESDGRKLKMFASPWSPPAWMKTSKSLVRGHLIDDDKIYSAYANYLVKFFESYRDNGILFWGATVQNEPLTSYMPTYYFNSLQFSDKEQARFISQFYGPALEAAGFNKTNFKLMIGDDNLGLVDKQAPNLVKNNATQKYISGVAFHWYSDNVFTRHRLNNMYEKVKDKVDFMLMTEACTGSNPLTGSGVKLGSWDRAEDYATDIIEDMRRYTAGWVDWNMALDTIGGPNWAGNYVDAPVIVNASAGEFVKQPMFYALGHFSKFLKEGDAIVASQVVGDRFVTSLASLHFSTNHLIVNVVNAQQKRAEPVLRIKTRLGKIVEHAVSLEPKSINTFVVKLD